MGKTILVTMALLSTSSISYAQSLMCRTGEELSKKLQVCNAIELDSRAIIEKDGTVDHSMLIDYGLVKGFLDGWVACLSANSRRPAGSPTRQPLPTVTKLLAVLTSYVGGHPEAATQPASEVIRAALYPSYGALAPQTSLEPAALRPIRPKELWMARALEARERTDSLAALNSRTAMDSLQLAIERAYTLILSTHDVYTEDQRFIVIIRPIIFTGLSDACELHYTYEKDSAGTASLHSTTIVQLPAQYRLKVEPSPALAGSVILTASGRPLVMLLLTDPFSYFLEDSHETRTVEWRR